jgi:adenylate kinase family enzyme
MVYIFEGPRNSGKTFLSEFISEKFDIPRYQFAFAEYFSRLRLESQNSREAHSFAMGKELMLMQLFKDLDPRDHLTDRFSFIHDRGILTVLAWGIMEGRITESEMEDQVRMIVQMNLMDEISIVFITGDNPNKSDRNKDQWDRIDGDNRELESYLKVISTFEKYGISKIKKFTNTFDDSSLFNLTTIFEDILLN